MKIEKIYCDVKKPFPTMPNGNFRRYGSKWYIRDIMCCLFGIVGKLRFEQNVYAFLNQCRIGQETMPNIRNQK